MEITQENLNNPSDTRRNKATEARSPLKDYTNVINLNKAGEGSSHKSPLPTKAGESTAHNKSEKDFTNKVWTDVVSSPSGYNRSLPPEFKALQDGSNTSNQVPESLQEAEEIEEDLFEDAQENKLSLTALAEDLDKCHLGTPRKIAKNEAQDHPFADILYEVNSINLSDKISMCNGSRNSDLSLNVIPNVLNYSSSSVTIISNSLTQSISEEEHEVVAEGSLVKTCKVRNIKETSDEVKNCNFSSSGHIAEDSSLKLNHSTESTSGNDDLHRLIIGPESEDSINNSAFNNSTVESNDEVCKIDLDISHNVEKVYLKSSENEQNINHSVIVEKEIIKQEITSRPSQSTDNQEQLEESAHGEYNDKFVNKSLEVVISDKATTVSKSIVCNLDPLTVMCIESVSSDKTGQDLKVSYLDGDVAMTERHEQKGDKFKDLNQSLSIENNILSQNVATLSSEDTDDQKQHVKSDYSEISDKFINSSLEKININNSTEVPESVVFSSESFTTVHSESAKTDEIVQELFITHVDSDVTIIDQPEKICSAIKDSVTIKNNIISHDIIRKPTENTGIQDSCGESEIEEFNDQCKSKTLEVVLSGNSIDSTKSDVFSAESHIAACIDTANIDQVNQEPNNVRVEPEAEQLTEHLEEKSIVIKDINSVNVEETIKQNTTTKSSQNSHNENQCIKSENEEISDGKINKTLEVIMEDLKVTPESVMCSSESSCIQSAKTDKIVQERNTFSLEHETIVIEQVEEKDTVTQNVNKTVNIENDSVKQYPTTKLSQNTDIKNQSIKSEFEEISDRLMDKYTNIIKDNSIVVSEYFACSSENSFATSCIETAKTDEIIQEVLSTHEEGDVTINEQPEKISNVIKGVIKSVTIDSTITQDTIGESTENRNNEDHSKTLDIENFNNTFANRSVPSEPVVYSSESNNMACIEAEKEDETVQEGFIPHVESDVTIIEHLKDLVKTDTNESVTIENKLIIQDTSRKVTEITDNQEHCKTSDIEKFNKSVAPESVVSSLESLTTACIETAKPDKIAQQLNIAHVEDDVAIIEHLEENGFVITDVNETVTFENNSLSQDVTEKVAEKTDSQEHCKTSDIEEFNNKFINKSLTESVVSSSELFTTACIETAKTDKEVQEVVTIHVENDVTVTEQPVEKSVVKDVNESVTIENNSISQNITGKAMESTDSHEHCKTSDIEEFNNKFLNKSLTESVVSSSELFTTACIETAKNDKVVQEVVTTHVENDVTLTEQSVEKSIVKDVNESVTIENTSISQNVTGKATESTDSHEHCKTSDIEEFSNKFLNKSLTESFVSAKTDKVVQEVVTTCVENDTIIEQPAEKSIILKDVKESVKIENNTVSHDITGKITENMYNQEHCKTLDLKQFNNESLNKSVAPESTVCSSESFITACIDSSNTDKIAQELKTHVEGDVTIVEQSEEKGIVTTDINERVTIENNLISQNITRRKPTQNTDKIVQELKTHVEGDVTVVEQPEEKGIVTTNINKRVTIENNSISQNITRRKPTQNTDKIDQELKTHVESDVTIVEQPEEKGIVTRNINERVTIENNSISQNITRRKPTKNTDNQKNCNKSELEDINEFMNKSLEAITNNKSTIVSKALFSSSEYVAQGFHAITDEKIPSKQNKCEPLTNSENNDYFIDDVEFDERLAHEAANVSQHILDLSQEFHDSDSDNDNKTVITVEENEEKIKSSRTAKFAAKFHSPLSMNLFTKPAEVTGHKTDSIDSYMQIMRSVLPAHLNQSEAGPITADELNTQDLGFQDGATLDLDFFTQVNSEGVLRNSLTRDSLYVKFDPIVGKIVSKSVSDRFTMPPPEQEKNSEDQNESRPSDVKDDSHEESEKTPGKSPALEAVQKLISLTPPSVSAAVASPAKSDRASVGTPTSTTQKSAFMSQEQFKKELKKLEDLMKEREKYFERELGKKQADIDKRETELGDVASKRAELEAELKAAIEREHRLKKEVQERTKSKQQLSLVMEEYEKTISQLVAQKEEEKKEFEVQKDLIMKERDTAMQHLNNMEIAFNDVHQKYERSKTVIEGMKANEDILKRSLAEYDEAIKSSNAKYDSLKNHAIRQLETANQELDLIRRSHQAEIAKLKAMLKKGEVRVTSLEESLEQKTKENQELAAICDELINKVGSGGN